MTNNFTTVFIDDICKMNKKTYSNNENWEYVNYLDTGNIFSNKINDIQYIDLSIDKLPSRARRRVQDGNIIYSTVRPNQLHYGLVKNQPKNFLVSTGFAVLDIDRTKAVPEYVYYALTQSCYTEALQAIAEQSTSAYPSIRPSDIGNREIPLPPLEIQQKIAKVLSAIDDKIELNNSINNNLEQQIKALYNHCFTDKNNVVEISNLIDVRDGTHDSPKPQFEGKKLITSKHLLKYGVDISSANFITEEDYQKINERSLVATDDILISMIGTVGIVSYIIENPVDFAVKNVGIYRTSQKKEYAYYVHCFLNSTETQNYILSHLAGTTQKYISLSELRTLKINVPNQNELKAFNKLVEPIYNNLISNTNENIRLVQLRDTLLPKLMSGEIDVDNVEV